jgi:hypothetical protein
MQRLNRPNRFAIWLAGLLTLVLVGTGGTLYTVLSPGSASFSPLVYPSPIPAKSTAALTQCPNPKGLVDFTSAEIAVATRDTSLMTVGQRPATKLETDSSLWSSLAIFNSRHATQPTLQFPGQEVILDAPSGPGAVIVASACGESLIAKTKVIDVVLLTSAGVRANCNDCTAQYYFIDRRGHALLYGAF